MKATLEKKTPFNEEELSRDNLDDFTTLALNWVTKITFTDYEIDGRYVDMKASLDEYFIDYLTETKTYSISDFKATDGEKLDKEISEKINEWVLMTAKKSIFYKKIYLMILIVNRSRFSDDI